MGRFKGRKILGVILFCFVFCAVYGLPASAIRNNLSSLLPLSNTSVFAACPPKSLDSHLFDVIINYNTSRLPNSSQFLLPIKQVSDTHVVQRIVSPSRFCINTCLCFVLSLLTSRYLALFVKVVNWAKECKQLQVILILLLFFAVESKGQSLFHTFTTNDTFVVPAGVTSVTVEAWGAGGNRGTNGSNGAGGGGGGAYAKSVVAVIPGNSYVIKVGQGGAPVMADRNSSFAANVVVAAGGNDASGTSGGAGGLNTNSTGTTRYSGGNGGDGSTNSGGGGGSSASTSANGIAGTDASGNTGGAGGIIGANGGAGGKGGNTGVAGADGSAPGGGGGGTGDVAATAGKGGDGQVIVTWDCPANAGTLSGATNICFNGTTTLSSTVAGGTWSSSNSAYADINPSTGVVTAKVAGAGETVTMTYTVASEGCTTRTASWTLNIDDLLTIGAASTSPSLCINEPMTTLANTIITHVTNGATGIGAPSGLPDGVTASWAVDKITISGTPTESGTFNYSIPVTATCGGSNATGRIIVYPNPDVTATPASQTICSGEATSITLNGSVSGTTFSWTVAQSGVTGATAGSGNNIAQTLTASGNVSGTATYTITPSANGCSGNPITVVITVNPIPTVNATANQTVCNSQTTSAISFTGAVTGTVYYWTNDKPGIGLAASGTGNIAAFTAVNSGNSAVAATITVTPIYTNAGVSCTGTAKTFTITVNPTPDVVATPASQTICSGEATSIALNGSVAGTTFSWTVTQSGVTGATAGSGNSIAQTLTASGNVSGTVTYTITPTANGCNGTTRTVIITVNPIPTVNIPANQTVCNSQNTTLINFTGAVIGTVYNWTNDKPGIGLAASGTGNIAAFTAVNSGNSVVAATITVTPVYTNAGVSCTGTAKTFTITVNPTPDVVVTPASQTICSGDITSIALSSSVAGTTFSWTVSQSGVAGATTGSGNSIAQTLTTTGSVPGTATYTITPSANGCSGNPITVVITVNPIPTVNATANQTVCNSQTTSAISFTGAVTGTVYNWTNDKPGIGLAASGTGNIAAFTAVNSGNSAVTATITVTPIYTNAGVSCTGTSKTITITVNPTPDVVATPASQTICSSEATSIALNSSVAGTTFSWTVTQSGVTGATAGSGNSIAQTLTATGSVPGTATYTITPTANGCNGTTRTVIITVNPIPTASSPGNKTFCNGVVTTSIPLSGTPSGVVFDITGGTSIGLANQTGVTAIPAFTPIAGLATISITPRANGCSGPSVDFFITVNATPTLSGATQSAAVCAGSPAIINLTGLIPNTTSTISYTVNGIAQTPVSNIISNGAGNGSFTTTALAAANNGQILQITGITITSNTPNCSQAFSQNVTLNVNSAPVFTTCPATLNLNSSAGSCTAIGNYTAVASGVPAPTYTYAFTGATTGSGNGTGSGSTFNSGTTHVKVTAANTCGSVDCTFDVVVTDNTAPVISGCPANITVTTGAGRTSCDQVASWTEPTATDNCTATGSLVWTKTHTPGSTFPVGTTTVTYTAKDANNNSSPCSFTVTVVDNTPPIFTVPGAITVYVNASCIADTLPAVTGNPISLFDNCTAPASLVVSHTNGAKIPGACAGSYSFIRTWKVRDAAGNSSTQTQVITVADNIKPVLTTPPTITISCSDSSDPTKTGQATATDNCGAVTVTKSDVTTLGNCPGSYKITRTWTATDACGNSSTSTQLINVVDNTAPVINCPANYSVATPSDIPIIAVSLSTITATDNCDPNPQITFVSEIFTGLTQKAGFCPTSVTRTYQAIDACGNISTCTQTINVLDVSNCGPCQSSVPFYAVDLSASNNATKRINNVNRGRNGYCCNVGQDNCVSFNILLHPNSVGVTITVANGASPSPQDWDIDCKPVVINSTNICVPGDGEFHLFTFCKPGNNTNDYIFTAIPGANTTGGGEVTTRVDCAGNLSVTGVSNPTWQSIYPLPAGAYDSYLNDTHSLNPVFTAPAGSPPVIKYKVCGNLSQTVCGVSTDCDTITINVEPKLAPVLNINPGNICSLSSTVLKVDMSPPGNYTYTWYNGYDGPLGTGTVQVTSPNFTPTQEGPHSVVVVETQSGIVCSSVTKNFDVTLDKSGPLFLQNLLPLTVECNDANASQLIANWLASASASYTASDGTTVTTKPTNNYNGVPMNCNSTTTVTFTSTDQCGNASTMTSTISVTDTKAPVWSSAAGSLNRTVSCSDAAGLIAAQALVPTATDICDPTLTLTKTSGALVVGSCPHTGTYTNTWVARDDCNNSSTVFTQTITIIDATPPAFTTQAQNLTVECDGSGNLTELNNWITNHGGAVAADACGGAITWTNSSPVFSDLCGLTGAATVTFTATDVCGNSATSQATFTIADTQGPVITCPAPASGTTDNNECFSSKVVLGTPTATDNCSSPVSFTNNAPAHFPMGVTTVVWTATDACGNQSTCNQLVTVTDNNQPPTIACNGDVEDFITTNNCSKIGVVITPPTVTDNCPDPVLSWVMTGATTATGIGAITTSQVFNVGKTIVTYTVTDVGGHTATCSFQVWIKNLVAPKFKATCSPNSAITALAPLGQCQVSVSIETPLIDNPCNEDFTITNNSPYKTNDLNASGMYPVGVTNFTWTITDASGNVTTCPQTVTVTDTQDPTLSCPSDAIDMITNGGCNMVSALVGRPTFSDNCGISKLTYTLSGATVATSAATGINYADGVTYNVGITTVTYTVTDVNGRSATCFHTVWIKNLMAPKFTSTCPANVSVDAAAGQCNAVVVVPAPGINNPCSEAYTLVNNSPYKTSDADASGTYPVGVTTITWTITDASGNVKTCTQTVTVNDTQDPTLSCPSDAIDMITNGGCNMVSALVGRPTFSDNCGISKLTYTLSGATVATSAGTGINYADGVSYNVGVTKVTYTVTDVNGRSVTCFHNVWIKNLNAPKFSSSCPADVAVNAAAGVCDAPVNVPAPGINNPCNEVYTITNNSPYKTSDADASGTYPVGLTSITWTITDASGNVKICTQTVTVTDTQDPVLNCPPDAIDMITNGGCNMVSALVGIPTFSDNCGISKLTYVLSGATTGTSAATGINYADGVTYNVGITTVTYTVTDVNGRSATCFHNVWIKNLNAPKFSSTCPASVSVDAAAGQCNAVVAVPAPGINNPCSEAYTITNNSPYKTSDADASGTYPIGITTITWVITDASGNMKTCTQTVTVNDTQAPTITCPASFTIQTDPNELYATLVDIPIPTNIGDNCSYVLSWTLSDATIDASSNYPISQVFVPTPYPKLNIGNNIVTYTIDDKHGNVVPCSFTITVQGIPEIDCPADIATSTDPDNCTAALDPGVPTLKVNSPPADTWKWEMTGATVDAGKSNSGTSPTAIGTYNFNPGTTIITWTISNISGAVTCIQKVTVTDDQAPSFDSKDHDFCVFNIQSAIYDGQPEPDADIIPVGWKPGDYRRPDWYIVNAGELDITNLLDNCCKAEDLKIEWTIDFSDSHMDISGIGQPSKYDPDNDGFSNPIKLWGTETYTEIQHTITYTVTDCNNPANKTVHTHIITIMPRPDILKITK